MDKQELPINNPAERLHIILTRAAKIFSGRNNSGKSNNFVFAFCFAMNLDVNDDNFIRGLTELLKLVENIEQKIKQYFSVRKKEGYLTLTKEIRNYLVATITRRYGESDNEFIQKNTEYLFKSNLSVLETFKACVDDFEKYGIEYGISINKDTLHDLINDVNIWIEKINESQFDEDVKKFFIDKLMGIKDLLKKYYDHGSSGIQKQIYATMMEIGIHQKNLPEDKKEENKNFFTEIYEKLSELSKGLDLVNKPMTTIVVADKLSEVLPPILSQTAEVITNVIKHLPSG